VVLWQTESVNRKLLNSSKKSKHFWKEKMFGKDNSMTKLIRRWEKKGNCLRSLLFQPIARRFGKIAPREPRVSILRQGLEAVFGLRILNSLWVPRSGVKGCILSRIVRLKVDRDSFLKNWLKIVVNKVN